MGVNYNSDELTEPRRRTRTARTIQDKMRIIDYVVGKATQKYYRWANFFLGFDQERLDIDIETLKRCGKYLIGLNDPEATKRAECILDRDLEYVLQFKKT